jgi:hypothetical protein
LTELLRLELVFCSRRVDTDPNNNKIRAPNDREQLSPGANGGPFRERHTAMTHSTVVLADAAMTTKVV